MQAITKIENNHRKFLKYSNMQDNGSDYIKPNTKDAIFDRHIEVCLTKEQCY